jgi:RNA polymerase primary sigma factor
MTVGVTSRRGPKPLTAIGQYLAEVRSIPLLSKEEENRLASLAAEGDRDARTSLVEHHLPLVVGIARRYAGWGVPLEDLIQEGSLGLLRAAERFDANRGIRFARYASWWVRQHISRALFKLARTIHVPRSILLDRHRLDLVSTTLERQMGRRPKDTEMAAALGRPAARLRFLRSIPDEPVSLEAPRTDGRALAAVLSASPDSTPGKGHEFNEVIQGLPPRLQEIVRLRFGLRDGPPRTLREVGGRLHISRERVRQLERQALKRIRAHRIA